MSCVWFWKRERDNIIQTVNYAFEEQPTSRNGSENITWIWEAFFLILNSTSFASWTRPALGLLSSSSDATSPSLAFNTFLRLPSPTPCAPFFLLKSFIHLKYMLLSPSLILLSVDVSSFVISFSTRPDSLRKYNLTTLYNRAAHRRCYHKQWTSLMPFFIYFLRQLSDLFVATDLLSATPPWLSNALLEHILCTFNYELGTWKTFELIRRRSQLVSIGNCRVLTPCQAHSWLR